jgi:hypothetical protein
MVPIERECLALSHDGVPALTSRLYKSSKFKMYQKALKTTFDCRFDLNAPMLCPTNKVPSKSPRMRLSNDTKRELVALAGTALKFGNDFH